LTVFWNIAVDSFKRFDKEATNDYILIKWIIADIR